MGHEKGLKIDGHGIGAVSHMDPEDWARAQGNNRYYLLNGQKFG